MPLSGLLLSVYIKYISGFKIIWKYLPQMHNKKIKSCYWLFNGVKLTSRNMDWFGTLLGASMRYFRAHFGICSSILESCSTFYLMKFCTDFFLLLWKSISSEKFHCTYLSAGGVTCTIFGPILSIFLNILRNVKDTPDIFHECLDITVVLIKLKIILVFP